MAVSWIIEPEQDGRAGSTVSGNIKEERGRQSVLVFFHQTAGQLVKEKRNNERKKVKLQSQNTWWQAFLLSPVVTAE